jgi:hypothetical protein
MNRKSGAVRNSWSEPGGAAAPPYQNGFMEKETRAEREYRLHGAEIASNKRMATAEVLGLALGMGRTKIGAARTMLGVPAGSRKIFIKPLFKQAKMHAVITLRSINFKEVSFGLSVYKVNQHFSQYPCGEIISKNTIGKTAAAEFRHTHLLKP